MCKISHIHWYEQYRRLQSKHRTFTFVIDEITYLESRRIKPAHSTNNIIIRDTMTNMLAQIDIFENMILFCPNHYNDICTNNIITMTAFRQYHYNDLSRFFLVDLDWKLRRLFRSTKLGRSKTKKTKNKAWVRIILHVAITKCYHRT